MMKQNIEQSISESELQALLLSMIALLQARDFSQKEVCTQSNLTMTVLWNFLACFAFFTAPPRGTVISSNDKSPLDDYKNYIVSDTVFHL